MNEQEFQDLLEKEIKIDINHLEEELANNCSLEQKYNDLLKAAAISLKKMEMDFERLRKSKYHFYRFNYDYNLEKKELDAYINSDEEVQDLQKKLIKKEELVNYLERLMKILERRSYTLGNIVKFRQLMKS